jgi:hypothetical protein
VRESVGCPKKYPSAWVQQKLALDAYLGVPGFRLPPYDDPLSPVIGEGRLASAVADLLSGRAGVSYDGCEIKENGLLSPYHTRRSRIATLRFRVEGKPYELAIPYPQDDGLYLVDGELRYMPVRLNHNNRSLDLCLLPRRITQQLKDQIYSVLKRRYVRTEQNLKECAAELEAKRKGKRNKKKPRGFLIEIPQLDGIPLEYKLSPGVVRHILHETFRAVFESGVRLFLLREKRTPFGRWSAEREARLYENLDLSDSWPFSCAGVLDPLQSSDHPGIAGRLRVTCDNLLYDAQKRKAVPPEEQPSTGLLGPVANTIPFMLPNKPLRLSIAARMACDAEELVDGETPLVQTGSSYDEGWSGRGRNLLTAFLPWGAYTYEDAIVISESAAALLQVKRVRERVFRIPKGATIDTSKENDDKYNDGIIIRGQKVSAGEPLIYLRRERRRRTCGLERRQAEERGEILPREVKETSQEVIVSPYSALVTDVEQEQVSEAARGTTGAVTLVRIKFEITLPCDIGDKLSNRYGNKGVISLRLPHEQMPILKSTGERVQIIVNPGGVERRKNYGQILEALAGMKARGAGKPVIVKPFASTEENLQGSGGVELLVKGQPRECIVGPNFWFRPGKAAADQYSCRGTGEYGRVSGQPVASGTTDDGQRLGRMEIECLMAHDVPNLMRELLILRSDASRKLRKKYYQTGMPESWAVWESWAFRNLVDVLASLGLRLVGRDQRGETLSLKSCRPEDITTIALEPLPDEILARYKNVRDATGLHCKGRLANAKSHALACRVCSQRPLVVELTPASLDHPLIEGKSVDRLLTLPIRLRPPIPDLGLPHNMTRLYTDRNSKRKRPGLWKLLLRLRKNPSDPERLKQVSSCVRDVIWDTLRLISGRSGLVKHHVLGRSVDFTARAVIVPDPSLGLDECRLPPDMIDTLFPKGKERPEPSEKLVLLVRQPALHRLNVLAFRVHAASDTARVIRIHPIAAQPFGGDFDGDTMAVFSVLTHQEEASRLLPSRNFLHPGHGGLAFSAQKDVRQGLELLLADGAIRGARTVPELEARIREKWIAAGENHEIRAEVVQEWVAHVNKAFEQFSQAPPPDLIGQAAVFRPDEEDNDLPRIPAALNGLPVRYGRRAAREIASFAQEHDSVAFIGGAAATLMPVAAGLRVTSDDCGVSVRRRHVRFCSVQNGLCSACYGTDLATGRRVTRGTPIGIVSLQALMERATDLALKAAKTGIPTIDARKLQGAARRFAGVPAEPGSILQWMCGIHRLFREADRNLRTVGEHPAMPDGKHFWTLYRAALAWKRKPAPVALLLTRLARADGLKGLKKVFHDILGLQDDLANPFSRLLLGKF